MKRMKIGEMGEDLFSAAAGAEAQETMALIASPLVAETAGWLEARARTLGSLLASERAVEYVAILRAFVKFREGHEPEPLHEDLAREVCGEDAAGWKTLGRGSRIFRRGRRRTCRTTGCEGFSRLLR